ncbi:MAG TPA: hypothetical protein VFT01_06110 [Homoserinimonas sp.]|nr:hypothetical protein [Homoserinimonas sp.]
MDPLGFRDDRAFTAMTPATHDPYIAIALSFVFVAIGFFVFDQMKSALVWALLVAGFFWLGGAFIIIINTIRIPSWHRARASVRTYLRDNPGEFPKELRWYN